VTTTEVLLRTHRPAHLVLSGDIDLASSDQFLMSGIAAVAAAHPLENRLVIELGHVTFMDVTGLNALLEIRRTAHDAGLEVVLRGAPPMVLRLLSVAGVDHLFVLTGLVLPPDELSEPVA
jgi:anti-anti-sigma factor